MLELINNNSGAIAGLASVIAALASVIAAFATIILAILTRKYVCLTNKLTKIPLTPKITAEIEPRTINRSNKKEDGGLSILLRIKNVSKTAEARDVKVDMEVPNTYREIYMSDAADYHLKRLREDGIKLLQPDQEKLFFIGEYKFDREDNNEIRITITCENGEKEEYKLTARDLDRQSIGYTSRSTDKHMEDITTALRELTQEIKKINDNS